MDPGRGMANKNFPAEDSEHLGGLILGTIVILFSLCYEANSDDDTLKLLKPSKAQYHSKVIGKVAIIQREYIKEIC